MSKIFALIVTLFLSFSSGYSQTEKDCMILHNGNFTYGETNNLVKVKIDGNNHTEYHSGGKYYIKSKLEWVNDCEYNMTMKKVTIPDFPYKKGDVMNVKINKIEGNNIHYTSTVKGQTWEGMITKID